MSDILAMHLWPATESHEKTAQMQEFAGVYTRDRLRETSVIDRVMPPRVVLPEEIERATDHNFPLVRVEKEMDSKAFLVGFYGAGESNWFNGDKYEVWFGSLETQRHHTTEEELSTQRAPVKQYLDRHATFDLQAQVDRVYRRALLKAVASTGNQIISDKLIIDKNEATDLQKLMTNNRLGKGHCWVMTESRWLDIQKQDPNSIGYAKVGEIAFAGAAEIPTWLGVPVIRTIEAQTFVSGGAGNPSVSGGPNPKGVWSNNEIFLIAPPDFHGRNLIMRDVEYDMKRDMNKMSFGAWMTRGAAIGNNNSVCMLKMPKSV